MLTLERYDVPGSGCQEGRTWPEGNPTNGNSGGALRSLLGELLRGATRCDLAVFAADCFFLVPLPITAGQRVI